MVKQCIQCGAEADLCSNCERCDDHCQCGVSAEEFDDLDLED